MSIRPFYRRREIILLVFLLGCHAYEGSIYRVESGEDVEAIARKFEVSKEALIRANPRMRTANPVTGQKVLIPKRVTKVYVPPPPKKRGYVPLAGRLPPQDPWFNEPLPEIQKPEEGQKPKAPEIRPMPSIKPTRPMANSRGALRFSWPSEGKVVSTFGKKDQKMHNGIDILLKPRGVVTAAEAGKVVFSGSELKGYGNLVILRHQPKIYSIYAYLGQISVKKGEEVKQGQQIGAVGLSSSDSFYHFEIRQGKQALDPLKHLPPKKP